MSKQEKQTKLHRHRQEYGMVVIRGKWGGRYRRGKEGQHTVTEDWTSSSEHTMQCADDVSQNCMLETYRI